MSLEKSRLTERLESLKKDFEERQEWLLSKIEKSNQISCALNRMDSKLKAGITDDTFRNIYSCGVEGLSTPEKLDQKATGSFVLSNCSYKKEKALQDFINKNLEIHSAHCKVVSLSSNSFKVQIWF